MTKEMYEKRNNLVDEMEKIAKSVETETRSFSEDETKRFDEIKAEVNSIDATDKKLQESRAITKTEIEKEDDKMEKRSANDVVADFIRGKETTETRDMATTTNGNVIPTELSSDIIKKVTELSGVFNEVRKVSSTGKYQQIVQKNKMTAGWTDELAAVTAADATFDIVEIDHFKLGSLAKLSTELINQANFDITSEVTMQQSDDFALKAETAIIKGTGVKQPTGLTSSGTVYTLASKTAITADEIVKIYFSIKAPYLPNAKWIMSRATLCAVSLLKDTTGKYLFNQDVTGGFEGYILGKPVMISEAMDDFGSVTVPVLFGDFSKAYIANVNPQQTIQILKEVYASQGAIGVLGFMFMDGKPVNSAAYATVKCPV